MLNRHDSFIVCVASFLSGIEDANDAILLDLMSDLVRKCESSYFKKPIYNKAGDNKKRVRHDG